MSQIYKNCFAHRSTKKTLRWLVVDCVVL
jgi:hypothetical protein